jgi:exonuclease SbcD
MRLLHTSDWHLGQTLHGHDRHAEHAVFLDWLIDQLEQRQIDALLVAGDIFDSANPGAEAQRLYYSFLARAGQRCPQLQIVLIAGNHDSPLRIDAPQAVLQALRVHVLGQYRTDATANQRVPVALQDRDGRIGAWVLAVPFLRPGDLPEGFAGAYADGIAAVYRREMEAALALRAPDQALLAMGHLHVLGGQISEHSERRLVIGGQEAVSADLFPEELAYVALGHLHLAQQIGAPRIRYSGSPLPLSFSELGYPHQIVEFTLQGAQLASIEALAVPRPAPIMRIPERHRPLAEVLPLLHALDFSDAPIGLQPLIEVLVERAWGDPDPAAEVRAALDGKRLRLAAIKAVRPAGSAHAPASAPRLSIDELKPAPLFERLVREQTGAEPAPELWSAFGELLVAAEHAER